ncbi:hypothetical protein Q4534_14020 [Cyclobacterium sp. 1_MG-2023]|uniref:hypothetical protein n=1 Tax=Cyclobacterium sp. 1_MG-2023 TaxID=3062681 RepID=UPI0026E1773E|nr:hypothetical protein [Cyclobacterium sp. 1_MG-2023]MDO6438535.1 hypothetical protein [Cyclobacterium sp. 1_MG-2023]
MGKLFLLILVVFLIEVRLVAAQKIEEFDAQMLIGYWQTDSVNQLSAINNVLSAKDSLNRKVTSEEMKQAIKSRSFIFSEDGIFTAQWVMGKRQNIVDGKWKIEGTSQIAIEINGIKTSYSVRANGKDGILLIPMKARRGQIHELYFTKKNAK